MNRTRKAEAVLLFKSILCYTSRQQMSTFSNLLSVCWSAGAPHLGAVRIPVDEVVSGKKVEGWFHLTGPTATRKHGKPMQAQVCPALFMPTGQPITCKDMLSKTSGTRGLRYHHMSNTQPASMWHFAGCFDVLLTRMTLSLILTSHQIVHQHQVSRQATSRLCKLLNQNTR